MASEEPIRKFFYVGMWVSPDVVSGIKPLVKLGTAFSLYIEGGILKVDIINGGTETITSALTVVADTWQFISFQFNAGTVYLAVDDLVYKGSSTLATFVDHGTDLSVGYDGTNYYDGKIDELLIDANVRLRDDIPVVNDTPSFNDALFWTFSENAGSSVYPADMMGPTLALTGGTWVAGYRRYAVQFNGTTDYASTTTTAETFGDDKISVEVQVKFDVDAACPIISQTNGINLLYTGTHIQANINGTSIGDTNIAPLTIDTDEWYDICVTYGGGMMAAWVNGQKFGEVVVTGTPSMPAGTLYLARNVAGDSFGSCRIALVRVYRAILRPYWRAVDRFCFGQHGFETTDEWIFG